ncbi:MAG: 23S rRNA (uracil(1939)-C(5))-methyltransferase RlmD [Candidatus Mcinerneyibacterium aminivorans]|uniref:23S rRNA (Uracil(1939)-C(5))-methyltransferase RlmD n=1 Tax=Candidatus Mcinerneyibacterium aminivorans TaxID=2703815 RepID=A0A5D0MM76_9BACT|nr:MAG: 23S rRNA (uracil(1939)-C(5))-methyltransferase RlmD [Candidatus Mcinerneyibacterium aminivorans]
MENLKKGQVIEIKIDNIGVEGDGVGRIEDFVVFVKNALPSEKVKAQISSVHKNFAKAELVEIIESSHFRKDPECPHYKNCGACDFMHIQYYKTLEFKKQFLFNNLKKIANIDFPKENIEIIGAENKLYYRNKVLQHVGEDKNGNLISGFYQKGTHHIIEVPNCKIQNSKANEIFDYIIKKANQLNIEPYDRKSKKGYLKQIGYRYSPRTQKFMLIFVTNTDNKKPLKKLVQSIEFKFGNIASIYMSVAGKDKDTLSNKNILLSGKQYLDIYLGKAIYKLLPDTFFQINSEQAEVMFKKIMSYLPFERLDTIWDLYGGVGAISFFLASEFRKILMFERNKNSIKIAKVNKKINFATNVEIVQADLDNCSFSEYEKPDVVVMDPPRSGVSQNIIDMLNRVKPKKIIFVSCDTATLARDMNKLKENYSIKKLSITDMFPQTHHVETVGMLERKEVLWMKKN